MILRSYAKLNLLLRVLRRRPDGFHDLLSVMQTVSLHDRITLEPSNEEGIHLTCDDPELPTDTRNLAYRAAEAFYGRAGFEPFLHIHLQKRIPMQAGLGGGSSNAAAVLYGLNTMHGGPLEAREIHALAGTLGSDVPFFLRGGCAVAEGKGKRLSPRTSLHPLHALIVCPKFGVETPWAYARVTPRETVSPAFSDLLAGDPLRLDTLLPHLENDLEPAVREAHPEIERIKSILMERGAFAALMTGSGSSVFGLFLSAVDAERVRESPELREYRTFVALSVEAGSEEESHADGRKSDE